MGLGIVFECFPSCEEYISRMPSHAPNRIGEYQVLSELGRGGMGIVYKVQDARNNRVAALKIVDPETLGRRETAMRFKREFRAMQRVKHPNVIRVFEAGTHEGCPFFTMELIEGKPILKWLDGPTPIIRLGGDAPPEGEFTLEQRERLNAPDRVQRLSEALVQAALALSAIHGHRIVHRDLKPDNIHVSNAGVLKLMDFGIAKQMVTTDHSSGNVVVGTFKYLSPEQALGNPIDGRADLYCLGIIMYELLTGRHPFYAESSVGYAYHHARTPPPDIRSFNPEVRAGLRNICEKLLKKEPSERYASAEAVVSAIQNTMETSHPSSSVSFGSAASPTQGHTLFAPALVERETQFAEFETLCDSTKHGRGTLTVLEAASAYGKSRLLREFAIRARNESLEAIYARAHSDGDGAYQPYIEVLERLLEKISDDDSKKLEWLDQEARVLVSQLPRLARLGKIQRAPQLPPADENARFFAAYWRVLQRFTDHTPLVILLDDFHVADEMSIELTRYLADAIADLGNMHDSGAHRLHPMSLVLSFNTDRKAPDSAVEYLQLRNDLIHRFSISALSADSVRRILQTMIGGGEVATGISDALHRETGGIPGKVEDRIRAWAESGILQQHEGEWVLVQAAADTQAPSSINQNRAQEESLQSSPAKMVGIATASSGDLPQPTTGVSPIAHQLKRLSAVALDVAQRMAVAGEEVEAELCARLALRKEEELLDALDELLKSDLLQEDPSGESYRFSSPDKRKELYQSIPRARRQQLHAFVAKTHEMISRACRQPVKAALLYRHYLKANALRPALEQLLKAGLEAVEANALRTADERIEEAQKLRMDAAATIHDEVAFDRWDTEILLLRLAVCSSRNQHRECVALVNEWLPKRGSRFNSLRAGEVLLRLARSQRMLGDFANALRHAGDALQLTENGEAHSLRCRVKNLCGKIYEQRGQSPESVRYFSEALELARNIGDAAEEESARSALAYRSLDLGRLTEAELAFRYLLSSAEQRGGSLRVGRYTNALGRVQHMRARYDEAADLYRRALELVKEMGHVRGAAVGLSHMAALYRDQQNFVDAHRYCAKATKWFRKIDDAPFISRMAVLEAQILLDEDKPDAAFEKLGSVIERLAPTGVASHIAEAHAIRGWCLAKLGSFHEAEQDVQQALQKSDASSSNVARLWSLCAACELAHLRGAVDDARHYADVARKRAQQSEDQRFEERIARLEQTIA